jgi:hypothetical protein
MCDRQRALGAAVLNEFKGRGWINRAQKRQLVEQRELPATWPEELP